MTKSSQNKPISEIMTRNMCLVESGQTVIDALARMRNKSVSSVLIVDGKEIRGIITERDFVMALHTSVDFRTMACAGLMQSPVICVLADTPCLEAYHLMATRGIRHLAIEDSSGEVVGVASEGDLMRNFGIEYYMNFKTVGDVMSTRMGLLRESDLVADAVESMVERHQSCVLVVDGDNRPVGVLTERDVVWLCGDHAQSERLPLREVMRSPVVTVTARDLLHDAVKSMAAARIRRLAVVDPSGVAIGLLTHHEIVREMEGDYTAHFNALAEFQSRVQVEFKPFIDEKLVMATLSRLAPDIAMLATDLSYNIGYCTPETSSLLGLDASSCVGADVRQLLQLAGWTNAYEDVRESALTDGQDLMEATIGDRLLSMRVFLMYGADGRSCGFLVRVQRKAAAGAATRE